MFKYNYILKTLEEHIKIIQKIAKALVIIDKMLGKIPDLENYLATNTEILKDHETRISKIETDIQEIDLVSEGVYPKDSEEEENVLK